MGLIKAALGAAGGVLGDQWKEFFYCDSLDADTLMVKGQKKISAFGRSSNTSAEDNIISNGSKIAVNVGQCMMIGRAGESRRAQMSRANSSMTHRASPPFSPVISRLV